MFLGLAGFWLAAAPQAPAQAVAVTLRLDANSIQVSNTTWLRAFAQVLPALRPASDRIFCWYVDVVNTKGTVAQGQYAALVRPASDQYPRTSSAGTTHGANRRGIYDTFMNLPGAGTANPVELFSIPVMGMEAGRTLFRVEAGSGVSQLSSDFLVAPLGGGPPLLGGSYTEAQAELTVTEAVACTPRLTLIHALAAPSQNIVTLGFAPCAGQTHYVEYCDRLEQSPWQSLPNGPHNTGVVRDTNSVPQRFYRVRVTP